MLKRLICTILCLGIVFSAALNASAQEEENVLYILTVERFLEFAEKCRLDSYSEGLTVQLCRDIDLTGTDFSGIPIFNGTFEGNDHIISGLTLDQDSSNVGLFRYLTEGAIVRDLHVTGLVTPGGSGSIVGSLVGSNAGTIKKCSFEGKVSGIDNIGGLVGINQLSGEISYCTVSGTVNGHHFVGGIAGSNFGVIRSSDNHAQVNTTIEQNDVDLEDVTLDSIINSESAATVTDIGGICGTGAGVIRSCRNYGSVGYPQIGYNIGGIAGSWSGYLYQCHNHGAVDGRKEVGGIVGQLEPAVSILFAEDTLQTLQQQMDTMSGLTSSAGTHIQNSSNALGVQGQNIEKQVEDAQKALQVLIPNENDPTPPDADTILAAQNALSSSFSEITSSLSSILSISESTLGTLNQDIQGISNQMNAISGTIGNASENLGGSIADVSDLDTDDDLSAKIHSCFNHGSVKGDWNVGGITGAIALENDLDHEADLQLIGSSSLNYDMELRAVILNSENDGTVHGKKQNVGGIAGWVSMGLVKTCINTASVDGSTADYAGGIAGQSSGYIRSCSVKCTLSGETYTGGIAGTGTTVTNCRAMVLFGNHSEKTGAILGDSGNLALEDNYYLPIGTDPGAVDGISYSSMAEPADADDFFALDGVPFNFRKVSVIFQFEDVTIRRTLPYGGTLRQETIPAIPENEGQEASWVGSSQLTDPIYFDTTFTLEYADFLQTLESDLHSQTVLPVLLAQGHFSNGAVFTATALEDPTALAAYSLEIPESTLPIKLRCLIPAGTNEEFIRLMIQTEDGWGETDFTINGSYLVFNAPAGTLALRLEEIPIDYTPYIVAGSAALGIIVLSAILILIRRRRKPRNNIIA